MCLVTKKRKENDKEFEAEKRLTWTYLKNISNGELEPPWRRLEVLNKLIVVFKHCHDAPTNKATNLPFQVNFLSFIFFFFFLGLSGFPLSLCFLLFLFAQLSILAGLTLWSKLYVDDLYQCPEIVTNNEGQKDIKDGSSPRNRSREIRNFPYKQGYLTVMTLRVAEEGIHMTVDGKHTTSFAYRESLDPWLVTEVKISRGLNLLSVLASGLPTSESTDDAIDPSTLRSVPIPQHQPLDLFIGVVSTASNFQRRMAVQRSWMQYPAVKNGTVVVRFFVGLHKNQMVNKELWNEVQRYGDAQLMPFVDYYSLITWKTIAICIYGTKIVSAKYVMKTDDDAFVRVDEVLASLNKANTSHGLLYGLINFDSRPHRSPDSKWHISPKEWPENTYPPWAHGPGYVISHDIAKTVAKKHKDRLKMFKLEDVAMGIWISDMKEHGLLVTYINENRVCNEGCKDGYVVAHYQSPSEMLCLWQNLQEKGAAICCNN